MARYLIVANRTLGGERLVARLDELVTGGPPTVHLAVPVTEADAPLLRDRQASVTRAQTRLHRELARLRSRGVDATGDVLTTDVVEYVRELTREHHYDGVIVSTLPPRLSRWLRTDLPSRLAKALTVPVQHLEGSEGPPLR